MAALGLEHVQVGAGVVFNIPSEHVPLYSEAIQLDVVLPVQVVNIKVQLPAILRCHAIIEIDALIGLAKPLITEKVAVFLSNLLLPFLFDLLLGYLYLRGFQVEEFSRF